MRKFLSKVRAYIPLYSLIVFSLTLISLIFYIVVLNSVTFADFFNYYLSAPTRVIMAWLTLIFPFSVAEVVLFLSPVILGLLIFLAVKLGKKGKVASIKYLTVILSVPCLLFITFVWTYSSGYHTTKLEEKMGLDREAVKKQELYEAYVIIVNEINGLVDEIEYDETGASIMPYSYFEMSSKICDAYVKFVGKHDVINTYYSNIKPLMISEPMTYTHLSGIYSFMSGEANINVNYPDFIVATSSAHEMAHQRGIAREDECNFLAFAVLIGSDDPFLRYSAYLDIYTNVASALRSEDNDLASAVSIDRRAVNDLISYSRFFDKYRDSVASEVADSINNSYLQANGQTEGTKTYGMMTESVCAYLLNKYKQ